LNPVRSKPDVPCNEVQCEPDMHIVDFLKKVFFSYFIFSMLFVGLLTGFFSWVFSGFLKWVTPKKPSGFFGVKMGSPYPGKMQ
jgi:hypothetical protein